MNLKYLSTALFALTLSVTPAFALPVLQLGPGEGGWAYNTTSATWDTSSSSFSLFAYANSDTPGANGAFAWDAAGADDLYAYLVVSATPMVGADLFDVNVVNDGGALSLFAAGYGAPPIQDGNSLPPHDIFDTYFKIYQFQFDSPVGTITNTEPGGSGSGDGYAEEFHITVNSLSGPLTGLHFDLFVASGDGTFDPTAAENSNKSLVSAFAPFSHDAQCTPVNTPNVPEPNSLALLAIVGLSLLACRRHRLR
ncbi:MAG: choice-of-anchor N protein [Planctomycetales bacterium]|nr:choice-of-anchor N protein [Planctomycetales bacterium]